MKHSQKDKKDIHARETGSDTCSKCCSQGDAQEPRPANHSPQDKLEQTTDKRFNTELSTQVSSSAPADTFEQDILKRLIPSNNPQVTVLRAIRLTREKVLEDKKIWLVMDELAIRKEERQKTLDEERERIKLEVVKNWDFLMEIERKMHNPSLVCNIVDGTFNREALRG